MTARAALLTLAFAALLAPRAARAQAIPAGLGGNTSALVSQSFDVPVVVDMTARPEKLGAFAARLQWNPAVLQFQVGLPGSFGNLTANTDSASQGVIRLAGANPAGVGGLVTLGVGRFVPLVADTTTLTLTFSQLYAAGTFADLRPNLSVTNGQFCAAAGLYGDINADGQINSGDALIALEAAVGLDVSAFTIALGDVDGNGVTDTRDALIMLSAGVGIDVSTFPRVGTILGGACAPGVTVTMAIAPTTVTGVLVGQSVTFEARATGPTGALVTVPDAVFKSSDPTVLAFNSAPEPTTAAALAPGTVTVTAVRGGKDSAQTTVTVVTRRTTHYADAKAVGALNQLGTQALPYATIGQALAVARGGDTVRPQPGRYPETLQVDSALVLLGDTLADGTRPVLAGSAAGTGILFTAPGAAEVHGLGFDGFNIALDLEGPTHVLLQGVVTSNVATAVTSDGGPIGSLRVVGSRLEGQGASYYYYGEGIEIYSQVDTLVVQGTDIGDFGNDGVYAGNADSVAVRGSRIHDVGRYGVDAESYGTVAVAIDSTIVSGTLGSVYVSNARSAAFSHISLLAGNNEGGGLQVHGPGSGWLRITADSTEQPGYYWLNANALDSVVVDSAWIRVPLGYGTITDVPLIRVTNAKFVDVQGEPLIVSYSALTGGRMLIDSVSVTGDPRCDLCGSAFYVTNAATTIRYLQGTNLGTGVSMSGDSGLSVTNAAFTHVGSAIVTNVTDTAVVAPLVVRNSQFNGFESAIVTAYGSAVVDSNGFQNSPTPAIQLSDPRGNVQIVGNSFASVYGAINVSPVHTVAVSVANNVMTDITGYGIIAGGGDDSTNVTYQIVGNQVACNAAGSTSGYGIEVEQAHSVIRGNQVQACWSGISAYGNATTSAVPRLDSILGNTVTVPASPWAGVYVSGAVHVRVAGNSVTADTTGYSNFGDIWVSGDSTDAGLVTAQVDSNQVVGGSYYGIYVADVDSAAVRFNTVQMVSKAGCGGCLEGGIVAAAPVRGAARIYGNLVRANGGTGISAASGDTTVIVVDSNLVSGNSLGMSLGNGTRTGPVVVHRNRITGSSQQFGGGYGLFFYFPDSARTLADSNNIVGNQYGAYAYLGTYFQMPNNWWGDPAGPTCVPTLEICYLSVTGDSVSAGIAWQPQLTDSVPLGLPFASPPVRLVSRLSSIMARPVALAPATAVVRRPATPRLTLSAPSPVPHLAAARVPAGVSPARTAARLLRLERRGDAMTSRLHGLAAEHDLIARRVAARSAQLGELLRASAQRDSARAANAAVQVAAQRAAHARHP